MLVLGIGNAFFSRGLDHLKALLEILQVEGIFQTGAYRKNRLLDIRRLMFHSLVILQGSQGSRDRLRVRRLCSPREAKSKSVHGKPSEVRGAVSGCLLERA